MFKMHEHDIFGMDEQGNDTSTVIAHVKPASNESVVEVLGAGEDDDEGRSSWVWVRLASGDLFLGVFPYSGTYLAGMDRDGV